MTMILLFLGTLLFSIIANSNARMIIGGWTPVTDLTRSNTLLYNAVGSAINQTSLLPKANGVGQWRLFNWTIDKASSQVVAGVNYDVVITAKRLVKPFNCTTIELFIWYQPWLSSVQITKQFVKGHTCPANLTGNGSSPSAPQSSVPVVPTVPIDVPVRHPMDPIEPQPSNPIPVDPIPVHPIPVDPIPVHPPVDMPYPPGSSQPVSDPANDVNVMSSLTFALNVSAYSAAKYQVSIVNATSQTVFGWNIGITVQLKQKAAPFTCFVVRFVIYKRPTLGPGAYALTSVNKLDQACTLKATPVNISSATSSFPSPVSSPPVQYSYIEISSYTSPTACSGTRNGVITGISTGACIPNVSKGSSYRYGCSAGTGVSPTGVMSMIPPPQGGPAQGGPQQGGPTATMQSYPWDLSAKTIEGQHRQCNGMHPMMIQIVPLGCTFHSAALSVGSNCVSSATPFSNYGVGLLATRSHDQTSCSLLSDVWTFTPINTCISKISANTTNAISAFSGITNTFSALNGMGSYRLIGCDSASYTVQQFSTTDCSGNPASVSTSPLQTCTQNPSDQLWRGMQCIRPQQ